MIELNQGDVVKIEHIKFPIIVASKISFNSSGMIVGCPFIENGEPGTIHIAQTINDRSGYVYCEHLKTYDLIARGHKRIARLSPLDTMEIADAIQSIFDYIYP